MVRLALDALCLAFSVLSAVSSLAQGSPAPRELPKQTAATQTVYVTRTGEKCHRAGCRSLAKSAIPTSLNEAAQRYTPCKLCRPPTLEASSGPAAPAASTAPTETFPLQLPRSRRMSLLLRRSLLSGVPQPRRKGRNARGMRGPVVRTVGSTADNLACSFPVRRPYGRNP